MDFFYQPLKILPDNLGTGDGRTTVRKRSAPVRAAVRRRSRRQRNAGTHQAERAFVDARIQAERIGRDRASSASWWLWTPLGVAVALVLAGIYLSLFAAVPRPRARQHDVDRLRHPHRQGPRRQRRPLQSRVIPADCRGREPIRQARATGQRSTPARRSKYADRKGGAPRKPSAERRRCRTFRMRPPRRDDAGGRGRRRLSGRSHDGR